MLARALTDDAARRRLTEAVTAAEAHTSAELVVAVRVHASRHLRSSALGGGIAAAAIMAWLVLSPQAYDVRFFPVEALLAFVLGAFAVDSLPWLRRALTSRARAAAALAEAARATFDSLGVERTRDRTGVLIYLALLERTAVVLPDVGLDASALTPATSAACRALEGAAAARDLDGVARAIEALGRELGDRHPRSEHDENQLPDEVHA